MREYARQEWDFQLHVTDSAQPAGLGHNTLRSNLSTPCNGFRTMGGLVLVYCFAVTGFYSVFYRCALVFSAVGPPRSWLGVGVFKLYPTSSLGQLEISMLCPIRTPSNG